MKIDFSLNNQKYKKQKRERMKFTMKIIEKLKNIIIEIRNIRNTKNIHPSKKAKLILVTQKYQKELSRTRKNLTKIRICK